MKAILRSLVIVVLAAVLLPRPALHAQTLYNQIGIYTTQDANPANTVYNGAPGPVTAYVVIQNPRNFNVNNNGGVADITRIGGYEFKIILPDGVFLLGATLPPMTTNFHSDAANFLCGTNLPVIDGVATAVTLNLGAFTQVENYLYLAPVNTIPSIPGSLAITDYFDDFRLNQAYPASGSFNAPVFGLWTETHPAVDWSVNISAYGDMSNLAGVAFGATDGYDAAFDFADNNPTVTFARPQWGVTGTTNFRSDIRTAYDPLLAAKSWDFQVNLPELSGGESITVGFAPTFAATSGYGLRLTDHQTGAVHDLYPHLDYTYFSYGGSRSFTLQVGSLPVGPFEVAAGFSASINGYVDSGNLVTVDAAATDGYDPGLDLPEPGPPPANYVVASVERQGWPLGPRFQRDVRAVFDPLTEQRIWPLLVETDQSGPVQLNFSANFGDQSGIGLALRNLQSGQVVSLFPELRYMFNAAGPAGYRFELIIGGEVVPPLTPTSRIVPAGWSLVAPPLRPAPGANTLDDIILDQVPGYGYLFDYARLSGYTRQVGVETATVGDGFWLATDTGFTWTADGSFATAPVTIPPGARLEPDRLPPVVPGHGQWHLRHRRGHCPHLGRGPGLELGDRLHGLRLGPGRLCRHDGSRGLARLLGRIGVRRAEPGLRLARIHGRG